MTPARDELAASRVASVPVSDRTVMAVAVRLEDRLVVPPPPPAARVWSSSLSPAVMTPASLRLAGWRTASVPVSDRTVTVLASRVTDRSVPELPGVVMEPTGRIGPCSRPAVMSTAAEASEMWSDTTR